VLNCLSRICENSTKINHSNTDSEVVAWAILVQEKCTVAAGFGISRVKHPFILAIRLRYSAFKYTHTYEHI
jgi:hypothetical protein